MSAAAELLAELRSRGIEVETDGARLRWRPAFLVSAPLADRVRACKAELIALLGDGAGGESRGCPACRWPLDSAGRCAMCFDRLCRACGRLTGSYFILHCPACGHSGAAN